MIGWFDFTPRAFSKRGPLSPDFGYHRFCQNEDNNKTKSNAVNECPQILLMSVPKKHSFVGMKIK